MDPTGGAVPGGTGSLSSAPAAPPGYRLLGVVGTGTSGTVYAARQLSLDRLVAVKHVPEASVDPEARARFLREARILAALNAPSIVAIIDLIEVGDDLFIVMEHIAGGSLRQRLDAGALTPAQALQVVDGIASALDAAHAAGVVHRDLKPANVLLTPGGRCKVVDFGIASMGVAGGRRLPGHPELVGTPMYMAPEQARGAPNVDRRADVYALGVMAYEMLTGTPPFSAPDGMAVLEMQISSPPPSPRRASPGFPPGLERSLLRALSKAPRKRPRSAGAFARDLRHAAEGAWPDLAGVRVGSDPPPAETRGPAATTLAPPPPPGTPPALRRPRHRLMSAANRRSWVGTRLLPLVVAAAVALVGAVAVRALLFRPTSASLRVVGVRVTVDPAGCSGGRRTLVGHLAITGRSGSVTYRWQLPGGSEPSVTSGVDVASDVGELDVRLRYAPVDGASAPVRLAVLVPAQLLSDPVAVPACPPGGG